MSLAVAAGACFQFTLAVEDVDLMVLWFESRGV